MYTTMKSSVSPEPSSTTNDRPSRKTETAISASETSTMGRRPARSTRRSATRVITRLITPMQTEYRIELDELRPVCSMMVGA